MSTVTDTVAERAPSPKSQTQHLLDALPFSTTGAICILLGYAPLMFMHFWELWSKEQYQYFPFVILAFGLLLCSRFRSGEAPQPTSLGRSLGRLGYRTAWVLLAAATLFQSAWLAAVSLNFLIAAILVSVADIRKVKNLWGIWFLLWLLIPLPLGVDSQVIVRLQRLSSVISSAILDMLHINHLMLGNVLQLPDKQFFVDEACSGIVSIMSVIACGAIFAVWQNRSPLHLALLVFAGVIWAISLNVGRICVIALGHDWWDIDLSTGLPHDILGVVLFLLTFVALISTDRILEFLLRPIVIPGADPRSPSPNPLVRLWNNVTQLGAPERKTPRARPAADKPAPAPADRLKFGTIASLSFVVLGAISIVPIALATRTTLWSVDHAQTVDENFLPEDLGGLVREGFESIHRPAQHELGDYSKTYAYRDPKTGQEYYISFDFPFSGGWHELCVCYRNTGWTLQRRKATLPEDSSADAEWPLVSADFTRDAENGYVTFANFNADGDGLSPPTDMIFWKPWRRLRRRLLKTFTGQTFQVQVWVSSDKPIGDAVKETTRQTLIDARERLRNHFRDGSTG